MIKIETEEGWIKLQNKNSSLSEQNLYLYTETGERILTISKNGDIFIDTPITDCITEKFVALHPVDDDDKIVDIDFYKTEE